MFEGLDDDFENGSEWDGAMTEIIEKKKFLSPDSGKFQHELKTMDGMLNKSPGLSEYFISWMSKLKGRPRSEDSAMRQRVIGNEYYALCGKKSRVAMAVQFYTQAIFSSPEDSCEAALAHANRAAALDRMDYEEIAFYDCQMALNLNYPEEKMLKLLRRKIRLAHYSQPDDMKESVEQLEIFLKSNNMEVDADKDLQHYKKELEKMGSYSVPEQSIPSKDLIENKDPSCGRFITANEPIRTDDPIIQEKAFAFVPVYNDNNLLAISAHCQNCGKTNIVPFPCYTCVGPSYCSPDCCERHEYIHRYECAGYSINLWMTIGIAHLAMRNLLVGFEKTVRHLQHLKNATAMDVWNELMSIAESKKGYDYGQVLRLSTNFNKMESEDLIRYSLTAAMLITYLSERTHFFDLTEEFFNIMPYNEWVLLAAALLMRHMGQLVCNGHAISDMEVARPSDFDKSLMEHKNLVSIGGLHTILSSSRVFTAIFPKISLFNHSCDPNIRNSFEGNTLTVYAARDIAKGDEIFNCYGPNYKLLGKEDRQMSLKQQYCFECCCVRCSSNDDTLIKYLGVYCQNESCRTPLKLSESERYWYMQQYKSSMNTPNIICPKCEHQFDTEAPYLAAINRSHFMSPVHRTDLHREQMFEFYRQASQCLSEYHEQKQAFAQMILTSGYPDKKSFYKQYSDVALDNLNISRERFGTYSLEFLMAATYILDFITVMHERNFKAECDEDEFEAMCLFDIKEIRDAFKILSKNTREIFENYLEKHITNNRCF